MFDEMAKAKDIFWEEFQGTGMSHEIFDVLFDSAIEKLKRNLTSRRSRAADVCVHWKSCCHARPECPNLYSCYKPPPA